MIRDRANRIHCKLQLAYSELLDQSYSESPLRALIGGILSQRTRDENGGRATEKLLRRAPTVGEILALEQAELYDLIRCSGFYKQKATHIQASCRKIIEIHSGSVPSTRRELMGLPGVGPKTADIVLSYGFRKPAIAVDVHIHRIARRVGYTPPEATPEETKIAIEQAHSEPEWQFIDSAFLKHGKKVCKARKPLCGNCCLYEECDRVGVIGD
jgi:endonuclease-3